MPIAVKVYNPAAEGSSKHTSGYASRNAIPYKEIMMMSQQAIKAKLEEWQKQEAACRGRKDIHGNAALKVARLNVRRLTKRYAAVFNKLPWPDDMPVNGSGKNFRYEAPLHWPDEERIDEQLFLLSREKRIAELVSIVKSDDLIKVEIEFKNDQAYFEFLKSKRIIREEKVSDLMTMREAREILRAGTEGFLGRAFRALLSYMSFK